VTESRSFPPLCSNHLFFFLLLCCCDGTLSFYLSPSIAFLTYESEWPFFFRGSWTSPLPPSLDRDSEPPHFLFASWRRSMLFGWCKNGQCRHAFALIEMDQGLGFLFNPANDFIFPFFGCDRELLSPSSWLFDSIIVRAACSDRARRQPRVAPRHRKHGR